MLKKLTNFIIISLFLFSAFSQTYGDNRRVVKSRKIDGSEQPIVSKYKTNIIPGTVKNNFPTTASDVIAFEYKPTGVHTVYDLQSNAVPQSIWQDPLIPANVHAAVMYALDPAFADRRSIYLFSDDFGVTWNNLGQVPDAVRSGFPAITVLSNGAAVIADHNGSNGTTVHNKTYADAGPGFGVFTELDPGVAPAPLIGDPIWARIISTSSISNTRKFVFAASINGGTANTFTNTSNTITTPPSFTGYSEYPGENAETYSFARSASGKICHGYVEVGTNDAFIRESTDDGLSWQAPVRVWDWTTTDSIGVSRAILVAYIENDPVAIFGTQWLDDAQSFDPTRPSQIRCWKGGTVTMVADSSSVPFFPNLGNVADGYTPICRPSVGKSLSGNVLVVVFEATSGQYNFAADSSSYFQGWMAVSYNQGATWTHRQRITPTTPLRDWRFVSISPYNNVANNEIIAQVMIQSDSIAGTFVNGSPQGDGEMVGIRITGIPLTGINNISSVVPGNYNLHQNYPNPFNPTTAIRFDITKSTNITLKVYNSSGQEVATLINNEVVSPGTKEVTFSSSDLSSGIYFYTLFAGDFKETKKMMLIK